MINNHGVSYERTYCCFRNSWHTRIEKMGVRYTVRTLLGFSSDNDAALQPYLLMRASPSNDPEDEASPTTEMGTC